MTDIIELSMTLDASNSHLKASQLLAERAQLSQSKVKEAMQKGAVWLIRGKEKKRLRRAGRALRSGDRLELNYNAKIIEQEVPEPLLVHDAGEYSVWFKPFGLNCQGSRWGDFATINRWVELNLPKLTQTPERPALLVHRLDRATTGLILLAHSKKAANLFSELFRNSKVDKRYQAIVKGDFSTVPKEYELKLPVDGKEACSIFSFNALKEGRSLVDVKLLTGRKHQIRQHLRALGYPIVGDRLYGEAEEGSEDLQLQSVSLRFISPITGQQERFDVPSTLALVL